MENPRSLLQTVRPLLSPRAELCQRESAEPLLAVPGALVRYILRRGQHCFPFRLSAQRLL